MANKVSEKPSVTAKTKKVADSVPAAVSASKVAGKKISPPKDGAAPNGLQKPLQPSSELAVVVGSDPLPRGEVVSKVWAYIKKHELQNPQNKREILADEALQKVFGRDKVTMFEMNKYLAQHLS